MKPLKELEQRLHGELARSMSRRCFEHVITTQIKEKGCMSGQARRANNTGWIPHTSSAASSDALSRPYIAANGRGTSPELAMSCPHISGVFKVGLRFRLLFGPHLMLIIMPEPPGNAARHRSAYHVSRALCQRQH